MPPWLSEFFAFDSITVALASQWGATQDVWGNPLPFDGDVFPVLLVLPMGWSWSFWIVQTLHEEFLKEAGFTNERLLTSAWPAPSVERQPLALPYCDNLTVIGVSAPVVDSALSSLMKVFTRHGFELHEIEWAGVTRDVLGFTFRGDQRCVRPKPLRAWTLAQALRGAARARFLSGRQLQKLVGHFVSQVLVARPALSIFRACYTFIQETPFTFVRPWHSV